MRNDTNMFDDDLIDDLDDSELDEIDFDDELEIAVEERIRDTKKTIRGHCYSLLLLLIPIFLGGVLLIGGILDFFDIEATDVKTISYESIEEGEEYFFEELKYVGTYVCRNPEQLGGLPQDGFIVSFVDGDGKTVYASVEKDFIATLPGGECYSPEQDTVFTGCFHGYDYYHRNFRAAYQSVSAEYPGELLDMHFYYDVRTIEDYRSDSLVGPCFFCVMGLPILALGVYGIIRTIHKIKGLRQRMKDYEDDTCFL